MDKPTVFSSMVGHPAYTKLADASKPLHLWGIDQIQQNAVILT